MTQNTWSYLRNPFDSATRNSFRLMLIMSKDHLDKLGGNISDPDIAMIHAFVKTAYDNFIQAFNDVQLNASTYRSKTMLMENLLVELSSKKIKQWDIQIQGQYLDDTPEYADILPNNRSAYQRGAYDERINAVNILAQKLLNYPTLANVQTDVQNFFTQMANARTIQQGFEYQDTQLRKEVENMRVLLATAMHKSFAYLLYKYVDDVQQVESFFELQYIRTTPNVNTSLMYQAFTVPANGKIVVYAGKVVSGKFVSMKNNSQDALTFFVSNDANASSSTAAITLLSGEKEEEMPSEVLAEDPNLMGNLLIVNNTGVDALCEVALS